MFLFLCLVIGCAFSFEFEAVPERDGFFPVLVQETINRTGNYNAVDDDHSEISVATSRNGGHDNEESYATRFGRGLELGLEHIVHKLKKKLHHKNSMFINVEAKKFKLKCHTNAPYKSIGWRISRCPEDTDFRQITDGSVLLDPINYEHTLIVNGDQITSELQLLQLDSIASHGVYSCISKSFKGGTLTQRFIFGGPELVDVCFPQDNKPVHNIIDKWDHLFDVRKIKKLLRHLMKKRVPRGELCDDEDKCFEDLWPMNLNPTNILHTLQNDIVEQPRYQEESAQTKLK